MRKSALADYLEDKRCAVSSAKAGHTGRAGRCPACETHLKNPKVRAEVESILSARKARRTVAAQRSRSQTSSRESSSPAKTSRKTAKKPVTAGVPVEKDGLIWWFDEVAPKRLQVLYWDSGRARVIEWSDRDRHYPPDEVTRGFARGRDASSG